MWDRSKYESEIPHNYIVERCCQGKLIRRQLGDVYQQNQLRVCYSPLFLSQMNLELEDSCPHPLTRGFAYYTFRDLWSSTVQK